MKPIGLTHKRDGELMIVHLCLQCGKISGNRIAGDDNSYAVSGLLEAPNNLIKKIRVRLSSRDITLLNQNDKQTVLAILFGCGYSEE